MPAIGVDFLKEQVRRGFLYEVEVSAPSTLMFVKYRESKEIWPPNLRVVK